MATNQLWQVIETLGRFTPPPGGAGLTDGQLLERYVRSREEAAFAALVGRHGPMVWGVCWRVLGSRHDAEDAFQATFLVLVRKAASVVPRELVGNWLYGVAHQTALKARATAARRRSREKQVPAMPEPPPQQQEHRDDLLPLLDQELTRLPDKYRALLVLCDLEGKTHKEAARHFHLPQGTVASRLATARAMLARRLTRAGLALSGAALATVLAQQAVSAEVPASVMSSTIKAASMFAAGQAAAPGVLSGKAVALTEGVLKTMLLSKLKTATAVLVALTALGAGAAALTQRVPKGQAAQEKKEPDGGPVQEKKGRANATREVSGVVKAVDFALRTVTVADKEGKKTYAVPKDAAVDARRNILTVEDNGGGKLYALNERAGEIRLVTIDPVAGKALSVQPLGQVARKVTEDGSWRLQAVHLAYADGILVCPTNAGTVLGIDLLNGSLVWAHAYRGKEDQEALNPAPPGRPGPLRPAAAPTEPRLAADGAGPYRRQGGLHRPGLALPVLPQPQGWRAGLEAGTPGRGPVPGRRDRRQGAGGRREEVPGPEPGRVQAAVGTGDTVTTDARPRKGVRNEWHFHLERAPAAHCQKECIKSACAGSSKIGGDRRPHQGNDMATSQMSEIIQHLRRTALLREGVGLTDGQLLEDYISRRDEAALAALVRQHGAMVWGVCRRVLGNYHDAEDAFQATFLVLVRKAASIASRELLANWLYGVAHQTALKARATAAKRRTRESQVTEMSEPAATEHDHWCDLQPLLDEELSRLPDRYRVVIVLCDLEGKTRKEAARQLGCPEGTAAGWLARARVMLARRLSRRGVMLSAGTLVGVMSANATLGCAPTPLVVSTVKAASLFRAGETGATGLISARVASLTNGVVKTMFMTKLKNVIGVLVVIGMAVGVPSFALVALTHRPVVGREAEQGRRAAPAPLAAQQPKLRATFDGGVRDGTAVAISGDGKVVASEGEDETVKLWDVATGREKATLKTRHQQRNSAIAISGDGKLLATGGAEGTVKLWDVVTGREKGTLEGHANKVTSVAISGDGKLVVSGSEDETVKLWDAATGREKATLKGHTDKVTSVAISRDGKVAASASEDSTVKLWDVSTGREKATLKGHTDRVISVAISGDGKLVASGSEVDTVKLWDATTGREKATLKGHTDRVASVAISGDGERVVSGGDKTVKLWDAATGREKATLEGHTDNVTSVAISRDGKRVVSGSRDKTVKVWDIP